MRAVVLLALLAALPLVSLACPVASAQPGGECLQYYHETWIGPGTGIVTRDSCHTEIWVDGYEIHSLLA